MIASPWIARLLASAALTATLIALLTIWVLIQDPMSVTRAMQERGVAGLAGLLAHSLWRQVSAR